MAKRTMRSKEAPKKAATPRKPKKPTIKEQMATLEARIVELTAIVKRQRKAIVKLKR